MVRILVCEKKMANVMTAEEYINKASAEVDLILEGNHEFARRSNVVGEDKELERQLDRNDRAQEELEVVYPRRLERRRSKENVKPMKDRDKETER